MQVLSVCITICFLSICQFVVCSNDGQSTATIVAKIYFDPNKDANDINGLILNKDIRGVASILATRTNHERQEIKISYSQQYVKSLNEVLKSMVTGKLGRLLTALLSPLPDYLIGEINWSLDQGKNWEYMSIMCTSEGDLLEQMVDVYNKSFAWQLRDIFVSKMRQPDGIKFLQNIIDSTPIRPNITDVTDCLINNQTTFIPDRHGYCTQQENGQFFQFMSKSSFAQIAAVVAAYQNKTKLNVVDQIQNFCQGDLKEAYTRIVRYAVDPVAYYVTEIYEAKSDDRALTLAIVSRCEVDLVLIRDTFSTTHHITLKKWIEEHARGDYENALIKIVTGEQFS